MQNLHISADQQQALREETPLLWLNPSYGDASQAPAMPSADQMYQAESRLARFAPLLMRLFPELKASQGIIESELLSADNLNTQINTVGGRTMIKADHALPVAGSIKARGGIHEVLCFTEQLALDRGLLNDTDDDYQKLLLPEAKQLFSQYEIAVGSTGNLGLSVGIIGAALGFKASVHMSVDAKEWKKKRLRDRGVNVVEHQSDYGAAVAAGRQQSAQDPHSYFVDDENSPYLFMGYAVAALRLKQQLDAQQVCIDQQHPLFVYLPAGVGGAPGGITYGLKTLFGDAVHCFFAEPTQAPCMLLGMATQAGEEPCSVYDFGLNINTDADGLAVGTAAKWVCDATRNIVSGVFTATDRSLYLNLLNLNRSESLKVEPSAAIGCNGPTMLNSPAGSAYLQQQGLADHTDQITHLIWTTGGLFVPEQEYDQFLSNAIKYFDKKIS